MIILPCKDISMQTCTFAMHVFVFVFVHVFAMQTCTLIKYRNGKVAEIQFDWITSSLSTESGRLDMTKKLIGKRIEEECIIYSGRLI